MDHKLRTIIREAAYDCAAEAIEVTGKGMKPPTSPLPGDWEYFDTVFAKNGGHPEDKDFAEGVFATAYATYVADNG